MATPLIIYHRGRHGKLPDGRTISENSLEAFAEALNEGAQMIELDVWDGLKVSHDPVNSGVPVLTQVLELINARCSLNIEIKSPAALPEIVSTIKACITGGAWKLDQFVVSSFHHQTALNCKKQLPQIRTGIVNDGVLLPAYIETLKAGGIDNLHLEWCNILMDIESNRAMHDAAKQNGMHIWVWTVNDRSIFETVKAYGAEAVFTDRPELLK